MDRIKDFIRENAGALPWACGVPVIFILALVYGLDTTIPRPIIAFAAVTIWNAAWVIIFAICAASNMIRWARRS